MSDLTTLSLSELDQLQKAIQLELGQRRAKDEEALLNDIRQKAALLGLTSDELVARLGKSPARKKGVVPAAFRNPDTGAEWSGRGRKPNWVVEFLNQGKALDDLRIR